MAFLTVTPQQLRDLATVCSQQAQAVNGVGTTVDGRVANVEWESPAAQQFRAEWSSTHLPNLRKLMEALENLGQTARTMGDNYEQADQAYKGGA